MLKILRKRVIRELRDNKVRYFLLGLLIAVAVFMVVSLLGAAETVIRGVHAHNAESNVEDGFFQTFVPLSEEQEETIRADGVTIERQFYLDYILDDASRVRIFRKREMIDREELVTGENAGRDGEIALERRYCEEHGIVPGDKLTLGGKTFTVTGIATSPDYNSPIPGMTDMIVDSVQFGTGFVTAEAYENLKQEGCAAEAETYIYSFTLPEGMEGKSLRKRIEDFPFRAADIKDPYFQQYYKEQTEDVSLLLDLMDSVLFEDEDGNALREAAEPKIHNLQQFVMAEDNMRIDASSNDVVINLYGSFIAGVVILALFAYVMTVFIIHGIDEDSTVIGALYAMGVKREELMRHYILLPTAVSALAGLAGTIAAHTRIGIAYQMLDTYLYYSVPDIPIRPIPYILLYGIIAPPLIAAVVSFVSIRSRLNRSALSLLRREKKTVRVSEWNMTKAPFTARFSIRQTIREMRSVLAVIAGIFICLVLVWIGVDCWVMCGHIRTDNEADTKYEYMYLYKYPEAEETDRTDGGLVFCNFLSGAKEQKSSCTVGGKLLS